MGSIKYIKDENGRVLVQDEDIKERWSRYFHTLYNKARGRENQVEQGEDRLSASDTSLSICISKEKVKGALQKMGRAKAVGPDQIPIEVWRCLGDVGEQWLTNLFNIIHLGLLRCRKSGGLV